MWNVTGSTPASVMHLVYNQSILIKGRTLCFLCNFNKGTLNVSSPVVQPQPTLNQRLSQRPKCGSGGHLTVNMKEQAANSGPAVLANLILNGVVNCFKNAYTRQSEICFLTTS